MAEDRLSQLPDDILHLILDKIGIFQAVETAILSERWKKLWRSLPALRFHFSLPKDSYLSPCEHNRSQVLSHCHRVSRFLSRRDASAAVRAFHLSFRSNNASAAAHVLDLSLGINSHLDGGVESSFVEDCARYAIHHGVRSLHLHCHDLRQTWLPAEIFACKTLKELDLRDFIVNHKELDLPELEKLTLLKYLVLVPLVINAPKLRLLKLYGRIAVERIHAPLLTSLTYKSSDAWECADADLPVLEHVYLDIHKSRYCRDQNHTNFLAMLHQLRNATTVSLTLDTIKVEHSPNLLVIADEDDMAEEGYDFVVYEDGYEYGNA
ncbi:F-box/LRR-repeat protein At3g26922-like [Salvia hispanica]|uniref:F-box/LRR-repeat protein At3g26922-like n=1 Tax=Salvia hispanica TaxID=49212 RepID=UPI0020098BAB|nr:F-box/LRR-repeat protein At3g26922-like [Salvia hispanica]